MRHLITIEVDSPLSREDLTTTLTDLAIDLSQGYLGDPSDWGTFVVIVDGNPVNPNNTHPEIKDQP